MSYSLSDYQQDAYDTCTAPDHHNRGVFMAECHVPTVYHTQSVSSSSPDGGGAGVSKSSASSANSSGCIPRLLRT